MCAIAVSVSASFALINLTRGHLRSVESPVYFPASTNMRFVSEINQTACLQWQRGYISSVLRLFCSFGSVLSCWRTYQTLPALLSHVFLGCRPATGKQRPLHLWHNWHNESVLEKSHRSGRANWWWESFEMFFLHALALTGRKRWWLGIL